MQTKEPIRCNDDNWMVKEGLRPPYRALNRVYMQKGLLSEAQLDSLYKIGVQVKTEKEAVHILKRAQKLEGVWLDHNMN